MRRRSSVIVALDGPSGAGKSSVSRKVARRMSLACLDTGALFRCVALLAERSGTPLDDGEALGRIASDMDVRFAFDEGSPVASRVGLGGEDVTADIRTAAIDKAVTPVCQHPQVRDAVLGFQREYCRSFGSWIIDGRDIGTVAFPDADVKIYLDASPECRARRRVQQNMAQGNGNVDYEKVLADILRRDEADSTREVAPLRRADDAIYIDSTELTEDEVVEIICEAIESARAGKAR